MLLDPFEKQFHLPARFVERADGGCRQDEVVGEEHQRLAGFGILESDAAQMFGIVLAAIDAGKGNSLIAEDAGAAIDRSRIDAPKLGIRLGSSNEEGLCSMQPVKPGEIEIASIHDVDRPGLDHQDVEYIDIAQLAVGDVDEGGDIAAQSSGQLSPRIRLQANQWKSRR